MKLRKTMTIKEVIETDSMGQACDPIVRVVAMAVVENPFAGSHPKLGKPMRAAVGGGEALIASNAKVAAVGAPIDLPLGHKDQAWSFDHFDTITVMIGDAPRADEIVLCMGVADGGRPLPRVGSKPITD